MKKISMIVLAFVFLLGATGVIAKNNGGGKNFHKPLQVNKEKVKHFAKKPISDSDRKRGDLLEEMIIKGKPANVKPAPADPTAGGVTGVLGDQMLPGEGKKYAIVIGLANYPGADSVLPDLCVYQVPEDVPDYPIDGSEATLIDEQKNNCKDGDSVNMEKTLIEKYGFAPSNVIRLSDSKATFSEIEKNVMKLVGGTTEDGTVYPGILEPEDELVFFFSGHGALSGDDTIDGDLDENDDGGIVIYDKTYDAEKYIDNIDGYAGTYNNQIAYDDSAYIWDGQLRAWFANAATDRIFFAFDTCHAAEMDDLVWTDGTRTTKVDGRVLAYSSGKEESSYTYYLGGAINSGNVHDSEGLFSHYFVLRAMYDGYADGSNPINKRSKDPLKYDGKVAVEETFSYAYPLVREASSNRQTPHLDDLFTNDLLLGTPNLLETVTVFAKDEDGVSSNTNFAVGKNYLLEASKVASANTEKTIRFDAAYVNDTLSGVWADAIDSYSSDPDVLELFVKNSPVNWGAYNATHKYRKEMAGEGSTVGFKINDLAGRYADNSEELLVNIYQLD